MGIIQIATNEQIEKAEREKIPAPVTPVVTRLASYVRHCWQKAYQAKAPIQAQLVNNLRAFSSEYSPEKLADIRALKGSEHFLPLTGTKCIAAISWLTDIFTQPTDEPWDIEPTPKPELPLEIENRIKYSVISEVSSIVDAYSKVTNQDPMQIMAGLKDAIQKRVEDKIKEKAKEASAELKLEMKDQLVEGGWYDAFLDCLFDLVVFKAAILKGPIYRKIKRFKRNLDYTGTAYENSIEEIVIPQFERKSPFSIYPAPDSKGPQDSYLCELESLSLKQLYNLIGVEGFNEEAIRRVIDQYKSGGLREWATTDTDIQRLEAGGQIGSFDTDKIDTVQFWGDVPGELLLEAGMSPEDIPDPQKRYDVCVWLIGNEVIKAMLNPDPMGLKPYTVKSYVTIPGSFWGKGLPELLEDLQQICNALVRAIVNNAAISSGPLVEWNTDRAESGDRTLYPWKVIEATNNQMSESPAVRFYQPSITADAITRVLSVFIKLADEYSVPSYAHGSLDIGTGGQTASGLSMLMSSANRVVKKVVKNADDMIIQSIRLLFMHNVYYNSDKFHYIGDVNITAKGLSSILKDEQQAVRRIEFLNSTANPIDMQIIGEEGRREVLKEVAATLNIDALAKVFPEIDEIDGLRQELESIITQQMQSMLPKGSTPAKKPKALDLAGNAQSGQDNRLFKQSSMEMPR